MPLSNLVNSNSSSSLFLSQTHTLHNLTRKFKKEKRVLKTRKLPMRIIEFNVAKKKVEILK